MQDMNGMKDKFDTALKRIGDEIDADQKEQNEKNAGSWAKFLLLKYIFKRNTKTFQIHLQSL